MTDGLSQSQLNDDWDLLADNKFAASVLNCIKEDAPQPKQPQQQLCQHCRRFEFRNLSVVIDGSRAHFSDCSAHCLLCKLLLRICERLDVQSISLKRDRSAFRVIQAGAVTTGLPVLSILGNAGMYLKPLEVFFINPNNNYSVDRDNQRRRSHWTANIA